MKRWLSIFVAAHLLVIAVRLASGAAPPTEGIGLRVLPRERCEVSVNGVVVNFRSLTFPLVVQNTNGPWLWVGDDRKGWVKRSQVVTLDEAPGYYTRLIGRNPRNAWAYNFRAVAWREKGELDRAIADFGEKIRLQPTAFSYSNRGAVWEAKKEYDKALADFNMALRLDPSFQFAHVNRGNVWRAKKDFAQAIADYNQAMSLAPNLASPYNGLAWIYATSPDASFRDGAKAVRLATRANELSGWTEPETLSTLAAAYAEAGDFEQAMKYQQQALDLKPSDAALVEPMEKRLELYRQKKPLREEQQGATLGLVTLKQIKKIGNANRR